MNDRTEEHLDNLVQQPADMGGLPVPGEDFDDDIADIGDVVVEREVPGGAAIETTGDDTAEVPGVTRAQRGEGASPNYPEPGTVEPDRVPTASELYRQQANVEGANGSDPDLRQNGAYPAWVFENFVLSETNYYGSPFADGESHLVPRASYVANVVNAHHSVNENAERLHPQQPWHSTLKMAMLGEESLKGLFTSWSRHFAEMREEAKQADQEFVWMDMSFALRNILQSALANRALATFRYAEARTRGNNLVKRGGQWPDWVDNFANMQRDVSRRAGFWVGLWQDDQKTRNASVDASEIQVEYAIRGRCISEGERTMRRLKEGRAGAAALAEVFNAEKQFGDVDIV